MKNLFKYFSSKISKNKSESVPEQEGRKIAQPKSKEELQGYTEEEIFGKEGADFKNILEDFESMESVVMPSFCQSSFWFSKKY